MNQYEYEVNLCFSGSGIEAENRKKAIRQIKAIFEDDYNLKIKWKEISLSKLKR